MSQRLRPHQRIRKRSLFELLYKKGKFVRGAKINLWVYEGLEMRTRQKGPKIGIVVGKKTSPLATARNTWKRKIREAFRKIQGEIREGVGLMVQSKQAEPPPLFEELVEDLRSLLRKTKCLR